MAQQGFDKEYASEMILDAIIYLVEFRNVYSARDWLDALDILISCRSAMDTQRNWYWNDGKAKPKRNWQR